MVKDAVFTALDVGTSKVCALVARRQAGGAPELLGMGIAPSQGLRKGVVVHIREVQESVRAALGEAARSSGVSSSGVHVSITGSHLELFNRWGSIRTPDYAVALSYDQVERAPVRQPMRMMMSSRRRVSNTLPSNNSVVSVLAISPATGWLCRRMRNTESSAN